MDPSRYPTTGPDWERRKRAEFNPVIAERHNRFDYPVDDAASPIAVCNFNAVGGSTILYSGHFPRFHEVDFELQSRKGLGADWPEGLAWLGWAWPKSHAGVQEARTDPTI
jgi:choline dehydrogenase-like flavoprotein